MIFWDLQGPKITQKWPKMTTGGSRSNRVEYEVFWGEIGAVKKKKKNTRSILSFHTSIFNQGGATRYVLRLIEWQNLKRKIVVFIFR